MKNDCFSRSITDFGAQRGDIVHRGLAAMLNLVHSGVICKLLNEV